MAKTVSNGKAMIRLNKERTTDSFISKSFKALPTISIAAAVVEHPAQKSNCELGN